MRFFEVATGVVDAVIGAATIAQQKASAMGKQGKLSMNGFLQMLDNAGVNLDYESFKSVFDANPQLKNVIAKFDKDSVTFTSDADEEQAGYEEPQTDMPDDERVAKMARRATKAREGVEQVQEKVGKLRYEPSPYEIELKKKAVKAQADGMSEQEFVDAHYAEVSKRSGKSVEELQKLWQAYEPRNRQFKERHYGSHENRIRAFYQDAKGMADFEKDAKAFAKDNPSHPSTKAKKDPSKLSLTGGSLELGKSAYDKLKTNRVTNRGPYVDVKVNRRRPPVDERSLTKAEKAKLRDYEEEIPDKSFKDRYGAKWKEVKYATMTKMAKRNA